MNHPNAVCRERPVDAIYARFGHPNIWHNGLTLGATAGRYAWTSRCPEIQPSLFCCGWFVRGHGRVG